MKCERYSPSSVSTICSSWAVPSVATTSACVSPRVKDRGAVRARQHAHLAGDRADRLAVAPVDARLPGDDGAAHDFLFEPLQKLAGERAVRLFGVELQGLGLDLLEPRRARLLALFGIGGFELVAERLPEARLDLGGLGLGRRQIPRLLRGRLGKLDDRLDHRLDRLVAEHDGAEHHVLGQLLRLRFDHQHALGRAGDDEVEPRHVGLVDLGIEHVLPVDIADAAAADGPEERNAGQGQRRRRADHGDDIGIVLEIVRQHCADDLRLVEESRREERPDRPVNEA